MGRRAIHHREVQNACETTNDANMHAMTRRPEYCLWLATHTRVLFAGHYGDSVTRRYSQAEPCGVAWRSAR
jgi:hypothetical protein